MAFAIGTALAFAFLDSPWRWIVIGMLAGVEVLEILLWLRLRRMRSVTGAEGLLGNKGRALTDCMPVGQIRVKGQIWRATCEPGVRAGEDVIVTAVSGLHLSARPLEERRDTHGAPMAKPVAEA